MYTLFPTITLTNYDIDQNKWHYVGKMPTAFIGKSPFPIGQPIE